MNTGERHSTTTHHDNNISSYTMVQESRLLDPETQLTAQKVKREGYGGGGVDLPLKSAGTRNFFLSMSGMLDLGTFSTITWRGRRTIQR